MSIFWIMALPRGSFAKYIGSGVNVANIEEVDFVWRGEPLSQLIGRKGCYDWIIASHVIEHSPDLISFLGQCEMLLKDDGVLSLIVPDKLPPIVLSAFRPSSSVAHFWPEDIDTNSICSSMDMREFAASRLTGKGLEIGAGASPFPVPLSCTVIYGDRLSYDDLLKEEYPGRNDRLCRARFMH